jgi:hypothetical protein
MDGLVELVRARSPIPLPPRLADPNVPYIEPWRWAARNSGTLKLRKAWTKAIAEGVDREFVEGLRTEEDWARGMEKLAAWAGEEYGVAQVLEDALKKTAEAQRLLGST